MSTKLIALAAAALVAGSTTAFAHDRKYDPDARAAAEAARIEQGRQEGSITYFEGKALRRDQQAIADREAALRAEHDGRLNRHDRQELKALQDEADSRITTASTNSWRRWSILPRVGK
jgi:hypothetical protein